MAPKGPLQCKRCQRFGHMQCNCGYTQWSVARGGSHPSGAYTTPLEQPQCCGCGENHTAKYCGCNKWKEARVALAKQGPEHCRKSGATGHTTSSKASRAAPSAERMTWARGGMSSEKACSEGHHHTKIQTKSKSLSSASHRGPKLAKQTAAV